MLCSASAELARSTGTNPLYLMVPATVTCRQSGQISQKNIGENVDFLGHTEEWYSKSIEISCYSLFKEINVEKALILKVFQKKTNFIP